MSVQYGEALRPHLSTIKDLSAAVAVLLFCACATALSAQAQNSFSSGSTGADGAFAPTANQTITVPESGVYNFTTVNIPSNVIINFTRNANNKPLTILASGDVNIAGYIVVSGKDGNPNGSGGYGGPGGFNGGAGGYGFDLSFSGVPGDGPGAGGGGLGAANNSSPGAGGGGGYGTPGANGNGNTGVGGPRFGSTTILPLLGGSGGGGGAAYTVYDKRGGSGGGGGGAILIASSTTITLNGNIAARGGSGYGANSGGGGGSGGAVRLIANTVVGTGRIDVTGGGGGGYNWSYGGGDGGQGYVRVEAYDYSNFNASSVPSSIISFALPHPITASNAPQLRIASVAGINSPTTSVGSLQGVPDIVVPATQANPVTVAIQGTNLPVGTVVNVMVTPARGSITTVQSAGLAGTEAASSTTASITLPTGMSVISASATIDLLTTAKAAPLFMNGERVKRIEVAATFGGRSEVTYVTQSGKRIKGAAD